MWLGPILVLAVSTALAQERLDILIKNGSIVDGSGSPARSADIGIRDGKIAKMGDLSNSQADRLIDADGLVVAPGFIDIHNHSDESLIEEPECHSMVRQGVTTMVLGEGSSAGPVKSGVKPWTTVGGYFDYVEKQGVAANIASYVGQAQIWTYVKGEALEPATPTELEAMTVEVDKAMRQGALGLSTSLLMPPSSLITTEQLIALAKVAQQHGGIYSTHIRDEGLGVFRSIEEAINVGKGAGIRVDIIHMKIADQKFWGQMPEVIAMIDKARADGHDIRAHVYPYTAGQNNLRSIIPPWAHDGGNEAMLVRLRDEDSRERIREDILNGINGWYNHYLAIGGDWERMLLVGFSSERNKRYVGKRFSELAADRGGDPIDVLFDALLEENGSVRTVFFHHDEPDMQYALKQPYVSVGSDGAAVSPDGKYREIHPHPRWYGTFPRLMGRYVRELNVLSVPDAVRKATAMNAEKIGVTDRGYLREGYWADVVIFDPDTVSDRATFEDPHQYPVGIPFVIVNGQLVIDRSEHTGSLPGKVIRHRSAQD